jgi:hypothetical protein
VIDRGSSATIPGSAGGRWTETRQPDGWRFGATGRTPAAEATPDADTAWRLFSRGVTPDTAAGRARVHGDRRLAEPLFGTVAIIA